MRLGVWLHQDPQELRGKAVAQYALCEEPHCTGVDPSTEGLHTKEFVLLATHDALLVCAASVVG